MKRLAWLMFGMVMVSNVLAATTYTVGILAKRGMEGFYDKWLMHAYYLCDGQADLKVKVKPLTFEQVDSAVANREVDFVLVNPSMYIGLQDKYGVEAIATMVNANKIGQRADRFGGVIFTSTDSTGVMDLADVRGRSFLAVKGSSLGGYQMAVKEFLDQGIDIATAASNIEFLGTHDAVVKAVIARPGTIGTVRTDTLERMSFEGKADTSKISVLGSKRNSDFPFKLSTDLYPEWPFAALAHVPVDVREQFSARLLGMPSGDSAATTAGIGGWSAPVSYAKVGVLLEKLGLRSAK